MVMRSRQFGYSLISRIRTERNNLVNQTCTVVAIRTYGPYIDNHVEAGP